MNGVSSNPNLRNVIRAMIEPAMVRDVRQTLCGRYAWRKANELSEGLAKLAAATACCLAFSAGMYPGHAGLSFGAGCSSTLTLVLSMLATYAKNESRERTAELNLILESLGEKPVPDLTRVSTGDSDALRAESGVVGV